MATRVDREERRQQRLEERAERREERLEEREEQQAERQERRDADTFRFNISRDEAQSRNLGAGEDEVVIRGDRALEQVRITFTSSAVGNGNPNDASTTPPQDGGLAVRVQAENGSDGLVGPVSRFDDEGITFRSNGGFTFDVRDISGVARGDQFDVVTLGTSGNDVFDETGESENYYINAGAGNDQITGGRGEDFLVGGAGNDRINGRQGNDDFIGGGGADTFIFTGNPGSDRINDFMTGSDKIDLSAYDIDASNVSTAASGNNTLISVDRDDDGDVDFTITLVNAAAPTANDYIF